MLAILVGCGLRRAELANLPVEKIQFGVRVCAGGITRVVSLPVFKLKPKGEEQDWAESPAGPDR